MPVGMRHGAFAASYGHRTMLDNVVILLALWVIVTCGDQLMVSEQAKASQSLYVRKASSGR